MVHRSALVVLGLFMARLAPAQQPPLPPVDSASIELRLADGAILTGRVVAASDTSCTVVTAAGLTVVVPRHALARWRLLAGATGGSRFDHADPNRSRLFLAPTARTLPAGSGYVGDYYLIFPVVGYGATDWLSLSGGMSIIPGLPFSDQLVYLAPKIGLVQRPRFSVAVGALYMRLGWSDFVDAWGGVAYGVTTFGGEDAAITLGLGWPFASGGTTTSPWAMAGGELRVSRGVKLLLEGWKFPGSGDVPVVGGVRFVGEKIAVDFGLMRVIGLDMTGAVPWVDFVVNW